jgi:hypothetical protein
MIYNVETGKRLTQQELDVVKSALKAKFPRFFETPSTPLKIAAKPESRKKEMVFVGSQPALDAEGQVRMLPPSPIRSTSNGVYIDKDGMRINVIYTKNAPTFNGDVPTFNSNSIMIKEGMEISFNDMDLALFIFGMSRVVSGGVRNEEVRETPFFFYEQEQAAASRIEKLTKNREYEQEIVLTATRMSYDKILKVMNLLQIHSIKDENSDRLRLLDFVTPEDDKARQMYAKAKESVLTEIPKNDMSNINEIVKKAIKAGILIDDNGTWSMKKSDVETTAIVKSSGKNKTEKEFTLVEYLTESPAVVKDLAVYLQGE